MTSPLGKLNRVYVGTYSGAGGATTISGVEVYAHPDGRGVLIKELMVASTGMGCRVSASRLLEDDLFVTVPSVISDPVGGLTTVVTSGTIPTASLIWAQVPDFMISNNQARSAMGLDMYVPPGYYWTCMQPIPNDAADYSIVFDEIMP